VAHRPSIALGQGRGPKLIVDNNQGGEKAVAAMVYKRKQEEQQRAEMEA
jgi:hypothetical protein